MNTAAFDPFSVEDDQTIGVTVYLGDRVTVKSGEYEGREGVLLEHKPFGLCSILLDDDKEVDVLLVNLFSDVTNLTSQ